jgi:hypothetical protein
MLLKTNKKILVVGFSLLMLLQLSCNKESPIVLPSTLINSNKSSPTLKITYPINNSIFRTNDTVHIHVEVDDNIETNYPSIVISRLNDNKSEIESSYGSIKPSKHFSADMGWLVVAPFTKKESVMIMASSTNKIGNVGKDSIIFCIIN